MHYTGLPEVRCFLNGMDVKAAVKLNTLWFKMVSMIFSVASGLPLGKEGPMIHAGAIIASAVSQGTCSYTVKDRCAGACQVCDGHINATGGQSSDSSSFLSSLCCMVSCCRIGVASTANCCCSKSNHQDFMNDKEKRDFVACGAGAGVAAAFGAPIVSSISFDYIMNCITSLWL